jgi:hypothetical protein
MVAEDYQVVLACGSQVSLIRFTSSVRVRLFGKYSPLDREIRSQCNNLNRIATEPPVHVALLYSPSGLLLLNIYSQYY